MTIDPNSLSFGQPQPDPVYTGEGAYGDYINAMRATAPRKRTPRREQFEGPFFQTQTGLEVLSPGQSAESTQARQPVEDTGTTGDTKGTGTTGTEGDKDTGTGKVFTATDGTTFTDEMAFANYQAALNKEKFDTAAALGERRSAFALLKDEFNRYGIGDLVGDVEALAVEGVGPAEFSLKLRQTKPYKDRFKANEARINAGLSALSEAEYVTLEDQYQRVMRQYGLPSSFYEKGVGGRQSGLEQFIAGDVSPVELEDRVQLAVNRVQNAAPEVIDALSVYYGGPGGITQSNLVAYVLDPQRALPEIQRKVQAAEIGVAAATSGFGLSRLRAEELAARGITQEKAQQGYQTASQIVPRAGQLAAIYGAEKYDQTAAEQEIFGLAGAESARRKRQKLVGMEQAQFGQQTGLSSGALERNRSGAF